MSLKSTINCSSLLSIIYFNSVLCTSKENSSKFYLEYVVVYLNNILDSSTFVKVIEQSVGNEKYKTVLFLKKFIFLKYRKYFRSTLGNVKNLQ